MGAFPDFLDSAPAPPCPSGRSKEVLPDLVECEPCWEGEGGRGSRQREESRRLEQIQGEREEVELRILQERLELLHSQRELAALKCQRFTHLLEATLARSLEGGNRDAEGGAAGECRPRPRSRRTSLDVGPGLRTTNPWSAGLAGGSSSSSNSGGGGGSRLRRERGRASLDLPLKPGCMREDESSEEDTLPSSSPLALPCSPSSASARSSRRRSFRLSSASRHDAHILSAR